MGKKSEKKAKSDRINALRKQYDAYLEEDKKRKERNDYILGKLDNIRYGSTAIQIRHKPSVYGGLFPAFKHIPYRPDPHACPIPLPSEQLSHLSLEPDIPSKLLDETSLLKVISKKYILIPKLNSSVRNLVETVPQHSLRTVNQLYTQHQEMANDINNDDWKSKYEILEQLKIDEIKEESKKYGSDSIPVKEDSNINKIDSKINGQNHIIKILKHEDIRKEFNQEIPEKDFDLNLKTSVKTKINIQEPRIVKVETDIEPQKCPIINIPDISHQNHDLECNKQSQDNVQVENVKSPTDSNRLVNESKLKNEAIEFTNTENNLQSSRSKFIKTKEHSEEIVYEKEYPHEQEYTQQEYTQQQDIEQEFAEQEYPQQHDIAQHQEYPLQCEYAPQQEYPHQQEYIPQQEYPPQHEYEYTQQPELLAHEQESPQKHDHQQEYSQHQENLQQLEYPEQQEYPQEQEYDHQQEYPQQQENLQQLEYPEQQDYLQEQEYDHQQEYPQQQENLQQQQYPEQQDYPQEQEYDHQQEYPQQQENLQQLEYPEQQEYPQEQEYIQQLDYSQEAYRSQEAYPTEYEALIDSSGIYPDPKSVYLDKDDYSPIEVVNPSQFVEEINNEQNINETINDESEHTNEMLNTHDFTPKEGVKLEDEVNINPLLMANADSKGPITDNDSEFATEIKHKDKPPNSTGIEEFDAEQRELFYSEETNAYTYDQQIAGQNYNQDYGQNEAYQDNQGNIGYNEGTQELMEQAYPVEINEYEETSSRYDQNYEQQYANQYEEQYQQQDDKHEPLGQQPEQTYQEYQYQQPDNETVENIEQALDNEQGFVEKQISEAKDREVSVDQSQKYAA